MKHVYLVIGLGRSGTSAITRSLHALGVSLGDRTTGRLNPKGSFEDFGVSRVINRRVLEALGYSWKNWELKNNNLVDHEKLTMLYQQAIKLLSERLENTDHFAFKAISTAKMIPFWQDICAGLQYQDHYIIALRNPLAAALSYQRLDNTPIELSLIQWLMHMIPAIENTMYHNRIVVAFDSLMSSPMKEMQRMQVTLNIPDMATIETKHEFVNSFLDPTLKHHELSLENLEANPASRVAPVCIQLYKLLLQLAHDQIVFDSEVFTNQWRDIKNAFTQWLPYYAHIDMLLTKNKSLEREIRHASKFTFQGAKYK